MICGIVKSSSSSKLKPTLFSEVGNSISYVSIVVSQNGVNVRSSSHGIKLSRSELWIWLSRYCQGSTEPGVCVTYIERH